MGGYKSVTKMVLTMAALVLLEDLANGANRPECVFRELKDLLENANWLIRWFCLPRPLLLDLCAELWPALECNTARSTHTGANPFWGSWQQLHFSGASRSVRSLPVNSAVGHASCVEWNQLNGIHVNPIPIQCG